MNSQSNYTFKVMTIFPNDFTKLKPLDIADTIESKLNEAINEITQGTHRNDWNILSHDVCPVGNVLLVSILLKRNPT